MKKSFTKTLFNGTTKKIDNEIVKRSASIVRTVTEEHSYIYASGKLLRETITTTAANGSVTTKVLDFAYDAQGTPYSLTYTNGTASPAAYYYVTNLQGDVECYHKNRDPKCKEKW